MAGQEVTLTFGGDARQLSQTINTAQNDLQSMAGSVADSGDSFEQAGQDGGKFEGGIGKIGSAAAGMSAAIEDAGGALSAFDDVMNMGRNRAEAQQRALNDVEQASADLDQAYGDLRQAQLDLTQSMIDGKQAGIDLQQAQIDQKQAVLDASTAQEAYNTAVKEHGASSADARQAAIDLAQAQADLNQANLDAEQAQADANQATEDGTQAQRDMKQASVDAKGAQLDLAEAQRAAHPSDLGKWGQQLQTITPLIMAVVGAVNLLSLATELSSAAWIKNAAAQVGSKIATIASAVATGIATAAQWLWNAAFAASGIGAIIIGVTLLVGAIILIATKTTWFQDIWRVTWNWIKNAATETWSWLENIFHKMVDWFTRIPGLLKSAFSGLFNIITWPYRTAFNFIADAWNATIGKLSWSIPGWVPIVGGKTISAPRLPHFHTGGIVPGLPNQEVLAVLRGGEEVSTSAGSGGRTVIELHSGGTAFDDALVQVLARAIGNRGGNVQVVLGGVGG